LPAEKNKKVFMMTKKINKKIIDNLTIHLTKIISETNAISLEDSLDLLISSEEIQKEDPQSLKLFVEFKKLLFAFHRNATDMEILLNHPVAQACANFFQNFPLRYRDEHIHLTGSLGAKFVYPRLQKILQGVRGNALKKQIETVYGQEAANLSSVSAINKLLRMNKNEHFSRYLEKLMLTKLVLTSKKAYADAAYFLANDLYTNYHVGHLRLKFTLSRKNSTQKAAEQITSGETVSAEDVVLGLFSGFSKFKTQHKDFDFILAPSFRKEEDYYDTARFANKTQDVESQVELILGLLEKYPQLQAHLNEIDTVGNERGFCTKRHFLSMKRAFRKLQFKGFYIRSHHGEIWDTLRRGIQAVDNAMNIWHIDTLEHGLSLGINPNYYFHSMYQRILHWNGKKEGVREGSLEYNELMDMEWNEFTAVRDKLLQGLPLTPKEKIQFTKIKFHTAREIEHYQHDVLNRMINKEVTLTALSSSNLRLTRYLQDYKDHPFSWWEKKGVRLGIGTDNYVTLDTNFIREMLILLFTDARDLKIMKLLIIASGEARRPYISNLLWQMRKKLNHK